MSNGALPDYVSMAKPNPASNRAPWYKNTAPTYAGIFLWFVFWSQAPSGGGASPGGVLSQGIGVALLGLVVAALLCHFLFYMVPGLLGLLVGEVLVVAPVIDDQIRGRDRATQPGDGGGELLVDAPLVADLGVVPE